MKFGPIPETWLERLALRMGKVPTPLLDVLFGPLKARVLMASVRLGILDALAKEPATAAQLAASLQLNAECLEMLLRVLTHSGYLNRDGDQFSLSPEARRTLAPGAPMDRRGYVQWNYTQWEILENLENLLISGNGVDLHNTLHDPSAWHNYQLGMMENARDHAAILAAKVRVPPGARSLIDLGGSHGLLGAAICRLHPPLRSTVFELEAALAPARAMAKGEGIDDLVSHAAADLLRDEIGTGHDVALLSNILHHFSPQQNVVVLQKVRQALRTGGTVAIWEFERPKREAKVSSGDAVALYFRLTSSGNAYHGGEYTTWLDASGFHDIQIYRPPLVPGYALISATA
jgi:hypothetical protein